MSIENSNLNKAEVVSESYSIKSSLEYSANSPLWQRVPTKDEEGQYLSDFMMIIPSLKTATPEQRKQTINNITQVLAKYANTVVFADLNMKMSLLWISVRPTKGMIVEISSAIMELIPAAKIISERSVSS